MTDDVRAIARALVTLVYIDYQMVYILTTALITQITLITLINWVVYDGYVWWLCMLIVYDGYV